LIQVLPQGAGGTSLAQRYMNIMGSVGVIGSLSAETIHARNFVGGFPATIEYPFIRSSAGQVNSSSNETTVITRTLTANTFSSTGMGFRGFFSFVCASNGNTKTAKLYVGANSITLYSGTANNQNVNVRVDMMRFSSSSMLCAIDLVGSTGGNWTLSAEPALTVADFTVDNTVKITLQGSSSSDITMRMVNLVAFISGELVA